MSPYGRYPRDWFRYCTTSGPARSDRSPAQKYFPMFSRIANRTPRKPAIQTRKRRSRFKAAPEPCKPVPNAVSAEIFLNKAVKHLEANLSSLNEIETNAFAQLPC